MSFPFGRLGIVVLLFAAGIGAAQVRAERHQQAALEKAPNPIEARAPQHINVSLDEPIRFRMIELDRKTRRAGRKPKVIIDPDGRGGVVAAQDGPLGFALYSRPDAATIISTHSLGNGGEDAQAVDLDRDGRPDIVFGGIDGITAILHNPFGGRCTDVYRCKWRYSLIDNDAGHPSHDIVDGDINRDGLTDVATESGVYLARKDGGWDFAGRDLIDRSRQGTSIANLEGDGILDVIAPAQHGTVLARFINPLHHGGDPLHDRWEMQAIDAHPLFQGEMTTAIFDINHNGRNDIALAPMYGGGGLVWYEAPPKPDGIWKRHMIDSSVNFVHQGSLQPGDFDGDGRLDIAFAEQDQSPSHRIGVFYSRNQDGTQWELQVLSTIGGHNIKVGRLGNDRRPSILSARHGWYGASNPLLVFETR